MRLNKCDTAARAALRCLALLLVIIIALCSAGCGNGGAKDKNGADDFGLREAQLANIEHLASAFRVFGEYDVSAGNSFDKLEYIVFCYFSPYLTETGPAGFGTVSAEEADAVINRIFGSFSIFDVMRRKYDESADQTYYFKNGSYKVMITDDSAYTYEIKSVEKDSSEGSDAYNVSISVMRSGVKELDIDFKLLPVGDEFRVERCTVHMWY